MQSDWLTYAQRLQALASSGHHFSRDSFERERYGEIGEIARAMLAGLAGTPPARLDGFFSDFGQSYATPKIDVRGAVISGETILLVREKCDGLWALPGGYADVGRSPAENVVKEIREEAGIEVAVTQLIAIRHKARGDYTPDLRDFYKLHFLCEQVGDTAPVPGDETLEARFFPRSALPPLSEGRVIVRDIEDAFAARGGRAPAALFD